MESLFKKPEVGKPTLMVGLPPDGPFAGVQRSYNSLQKAKKETEKEVLEAGRKQVRACVEAYRYQVGQQQHYFKGAKSWAHVADSKAGASHRQGCPSAVGAAKGPVICM